MIIGLAHLPACFTLVSLFFYSLSTPLPSRSLAFQICEIYLETDKFQFLY